MKAARHESSAGGLSESGIPISTKERKIGRSERDVALRRELATLKIIGGESMERGEESDLVELLFDGEVRRSHAHDLLPCSFDAAI